MRYARNIRDQRRHFADDPQRMGSFRYGQERQGHSFYDNDVIYGDRRSNYPWESDHDTEEYDEFDFDDYYDDDDFDNNNYRNRNVEEWDDEELDYPVYEYDEYFDDLDEDPEYRYHAYDDMDEYNEYHSGHREHSAGGSYNYPYGYRRAGSPGADFYQRDDERSPRVRQPDNRYPELRANSPRFAGNRRHSYKPRSKEWNYGPEW